MTYTSQKVTISIDYSNIVIRFLTKKMDQSSFAFRLDLETTNEANVDKRATQKERHQEVFGAQSDETQVKRQRETYAVELRRQKR